MFERRGNRSWGWEEVIHSWSERRRVVRYILEIKDMRSAFVNDEIEHLIYKVEEVLDYNGIYHGEITLVKEEEK